MTNEEAIKVLQSLIPVPKRGDTRSTETTEISVALIMAISALSQMESAGTQITNSNLKSESEKPIKHFGSIECPNCGRLLMLEEQPTEELDGDLISRTDLLNAIWQKEYGKYYDEVNLLSIPHIDIIENMPSVEKTAEWIIGSYEVKCSHCEYLVWGSGLNAYKEWKFCPNCGKQMKGDTE